MFFGLMKARWENLTDAVQTYLKTGVSLIGSRQGAAAPIAPGDDMGLFYFVPKIAAVFNVDAARAYHIFLWGIAGASFLIGCWGLFLLTKRNRTRLFLIPSTALLFALTVMLADVYFVQSAAAMAVVPLFIFYLIRARMTRGFLLFAALAGILIGYANFIRAHAATPVFIFCVIAVLTSRRYEPRDKAKLILAVFIGLIAVRAHAALLLRERARFLSANGVTQVAPDRHLYWHQIYLGLGYLSNAYGIVPNDEGGQNRVEALAPGTTYMSWEYDRVLRDDVLRFVRGHPHYVMLTMFSKLGVFLFYLLVFGNVGFFLWLKDRSLRPYSRAFLSALAFGSLTGFLTTPYYGYVLSFIAFTTILGQLTLIKRLE